MGEVGPVGKQWNCGIDCWVTVGGGKRILGDSNEFWERRNYGRKWRIVGLYRILWESGELWDIF